MWQKFLSLWRVGFGLDKRSFQFWLANVVVFGLIGWFVYAKQAEASTYLMAVFLLVANSLILFLLLHYIPRIKIAMLTFLVVLNAFLFGYYYFASITFFF